MAETAVILADRTSAQVKYEQNDAGMLTLTPRMTSPVWVYHRRAAIKT